MGFSLLEYRSDACICCVFDHFDLLLYVFVPVLIIFKRQTSDVFIAVVTWCDCSNDDIYSPYLFFATIPAFFSKTDVALPHCNNVSNLTTPVDKRCPFILRQLVCLYAEGDDRHMLLLCSLHVKGITQGHHEPQTCYI